MYNVIIIGSGPAAYTAAIYLARAMLEPLVLEGETSPDITPGGLLTTTKTVENYPGFPDGIDGYELTKNFETQAMEFGAVVYSRTVTSITKDDEDDDYVFKVHCGEDTYTTKAVIIATGSTPKRLYIPGYDDFWHKGISTCAVCDGSLPMFRGKPIAVVGGGDSACEEALYLSKFGSEIYLLLRGDKFRASKIMEDRVRKTSNIHILLNTEVTRVYGNDLVESIDVWDTSGKESELYTLKVSGMFVAIGHTPNSGFVKGLVELYDIGYIMTDRDMATSVEGIWAAGDVQDYKYKQAITAAGSGCVAALEVERWLSAK